MFSEFSNITNNLAYLKAFSERFMLQDPARPGRFLGNTQREDFLPYLRTLVSKLQPDSQIFDFGAGAGEVVDFALSELESGTVNIEDPNTLLLEQYQNRLTAHPRLKLGQVHSGSVQDLYEESVKIPKQDLILGLHMIYHLSSFTPGEQSDPQEDILRMLNFMYKQLNLGGRIFLVYADQLVSTTGQAGAYYFQAKGEDQTVSNLESIWNARDELLKQGRAQSLLNQRFPEFEARVESHQTASYIYGKTLEDVAIMCVIGELGLANDDVFDVSKLELSLKFLKENPDAVGLIEERRDVQQKQMIRSNQPQTVTIISKETRS